MEKGKRLHIKNNSLAKKLVVPMILVMLIQAGIFLMTIFWGGTIDQLENNSFAILNERVINRKNYLQNEMIQRWSNVQVTVDSINSATDKVLEEYGQNYLDIRSDSEVSTEIIRRSTDSLISMLRQNSVTGVFLILNGQDEARKDGEAQRKAGIYIRDLDPTSNSEDNSDLLLERAPSAMTKELGISMDSNWTPQFVIEPYDAADYFYKPFQAAQQYPEISYSDLGYWSRPYLLSDSDAISAISYSVPLISGDGVPYGVLGVDITTDYLRSQTPYDELAAEKKGGYLIAVDDSNNEELEFQNVLSNGPLLKRLLGAKEVTSFESVESRDNSYRLTGSENAQGDVFGCIQYFDIYNTNTPFVNERWALIGVMEGSGMFSFSNHVKSSLLIAMLVSLFIGIFSVLLTSTLLTRPIAALVRKLKSSDPSERVKLDKINIQEIDELSSAIELLSLSVADSASKLSQIIELANFPVAAFEFIKNSQKVFYTGRFYELFGMEPAKFQDQSFEQFEENMKEIEKHLESSSANGEIRIYRIAEEGGNNRWVRIKYVEDAEKIFGVAADITSEIVEKRKIEYERDYDSLTNLLNRRAFHAQLGEKFKKPDELKTAALIMLDLDNLKYINDTYGHDYGDEYIRGAANVLKKFIPYRALVARMSGDEFYVFIYGYPDKGSVRAIIEKIKTAMMDTSLPLPDDKGLKIRASAGVAWYPDDTPFYEQLFRYADFAMYKIKNSTKGEFKEFDLASYNKDAYLLHSKEELNKLIDEELVDYFFQPIVDVRTGKTFAFEALMRSKLESLKTPLEILTLARSQFKLYQIERLTWFKSMKDVRKQKEAFGDCKIFINSIPNQVLSEEDFLHFEEEFSEFLDRLVVELTEGERESVEFTDQKKEYIKRWNGKIALDDFGTGYNGESMLLTIIPDYVKIDMSIVRDIDTDYDRREILRNLVAYSHERNMKVIAEGVETEREMRTLMEDGVDYLQGYYIGVPRRRPEMVEIRISESGKT